MQCQQTDSPVHTVKYIHTAGTHTEDSTQDSSGQKDTQGLYWTQTTKMQVMPQSPIRTSRKVG